MGLGESMAIGIPGRATVFAPGKRRKELILLEAELQPVLGTGCEGPTHILVRGQGAC